MQENSGFIVACGLLWASVLILICAGESDAGFMLTLLLVPAILIGWVVLLVIALSRLLVRTQLPLSKRAVPLWFATVPALTYFILGIGFSEIKKENTWLTIKQYDFSGSTNFRFMKDGTYSQWRESPLGSSAEGDGRYERQDSILTLHPQLKSGNAQGFKLIIHPYSLFRRNHSSSDITLVSLDTTVQHY